jgi:hypothetical protein
MQNFQIPPRSAVGYLDPEIANEGQKAGDDPSIGFTPPVSSYTGPTYDNLKIHKDYRRYFGRSEWPVFPTWIYHEDGTEKVVANAQDAARYGIQYREASDIERGRYGVKFVWDYGDESNKWRAKPWRLKKFDPSNPGNGKNYVSASIDHAATQTQILRELSIQRHETGKPEAITEAEWQRYQRFLAFEKAEAEVAATEKVQTEVKELPGTDEAKQHVFQPEGQKTGDDVLGQFARETARNDRKGR